MLKTVSTQLALASDTLPEVLANGNTTGGTDLAVSSGDDITFADNSKAIFGAGSDLSIHSDGTTGQVTGNVNVTGTFGATGQSTFSNNVGIGTASPARPLDVSRSVGSIIANFKNTSGTLSFITVGNTTATADQIRIGANGDALTLSTNYAERFRLDASGHAIIPAGVTLGTAAGVYAAANTLDDYEEGTWTPVLADASAGGNVATGAFSGTYVKIGKQVTLNCTLTNITTSGMTAGNNLYIRGLPFATGVGHMGSLMARDVTYSGEIAPKTLEGQSYLYLYQYSSAGAVTVLTVAGIASGTADLWLTVTYEV
jgi:hypothetical protein